MTRLSDGERAERVRDEVRGFGEASGENEPRIHFVGLDEGGVVAVRIEGCGGCCPASALPWVEQLEARLKQRIPGVRLVEVVP